MKTISVTHPSGSYPIYLGDGLLSELGSRLTELGYSGRCAVVTNEVVGQHYAQTILTSLEVAGFEPTRLDLPDGEQFKTLDTVANIYPHLVKAKLDRQSPIIALGGGVLGDTAGYAAATFLRGVPLVQIPTTLLAMVDSSVGGKTGVDLPEGKNLVGAFKQPELVLIDPQVLNTLPEAEIRAGLAEVVKHGVIDAPEMFSKLEVGSRQNEVEKAALLYSLLPTPYSLISLLYDAINVKVRVVTEDPFEQGRRAVLNLGHTFGHAFEQLSHYEIRHGEGVAMGTACAARLAHRLGLCTAETATRIVELLARVGLPTEPPNYPAADVLATMMTDKKRQGNTLRFILPRAIGEVDVFNNVAWVDVEAILKK